MYKFLMFISLIWVNSATAQSIIAERGNVTIDELVSKIDSKKWYVGSLKCKESTAAAIDVLQLDGSTFILRQNRCTHYEAPFMYLLIGKHTAFLQDTGAIADDNIFPLYKTVKNLMAQWEKDNQTKLKKLIVSHSHSHSDHKAADAQFKGQAGVTVIEPNLVAVKAFFGFSDWPQGESKINLGERTLSVIPIPGHHEDAVAIHDSQFNVMLTGDSFYPGRLYVANSQQYKQSMKRLQHYAMKHDVKIFLGTHIEMSNTAGKDYVMGSTYQPDEASLLLTMSDLMALNRALALQSGQLHRQALEKVIIYPVP